MDRQEWLAERQEAVVAVYDAEAPAYDEHEYPSDIQREWVARALSLIAPGGIVLDAPCGTGKYFPVVTAAGHRVVGADQSAGMLAQAQVRDIARRRGPDHHRRGLQMGRRLGLPPLPAALRYGL